MNFGFLPEYSYYYWVGTINTVTIAFVTVIIGTIIGIIAALVKLSPYRPLRFLASAYIEIIRGTPILVQVMIAFYGVPGLLSFPNFYLFGMDMSRLIPGMIAMGINSGAYVAEIIRAGILAVDQGQAEAARSLGMNGVQSMRYVIMPQAVKNILPALGNEFVTVIKESSILSVIGIADIMFNASIVRGATFIPLEPLYVAAAIYFMLTFSISRLLAYVERRLRAHERKSHS